MTQRVVKTASCAEMRAWETGRVLLYVDDAACGEERELRWNESVRDWTCSALLNDAACGGWNESVRDWTCSALLNDAACSEERELRWNESVRDWTCSALRRWRSVWWRARGALKWERERLNVFCSTLMTQRVVKSASCALERSDWLEQAAPSPVSSLDCAQ